MGVVMGSLNVPGSTGNVSVTGLPFQPIAVMFWNVVQNKANPSMCFGCATGSANEWVIWTGMDDETTGYTRRYSDGRTNRCIYLLEQPNFTTVAYAAEFISMNSDGFTVNFTDRNVGGEPIFYLALGGDHVNNAYAASFSIGASTGTTAVTAPGFTPNCLVVAHQRSVFGSAVGDMGWGIGATDGTTQYSCFANGNQATAVDAYHIHRTDAIACSWGGELEMYRSSLSSFDSNGFTVSVDDAWSGGNITHGYLAMNVDGAIVGHDVQPDSTGTQTIAAEGLTPGGVFFFWNGADTPSTTGSDVEPVRPGVGGFTNLAGGAVSTLFRDTAVFGAWVPDAYSDGTAGILMQGQDDHVSDPPAHDYQGRGEFDSFGPDAFAIDWTAVTSGADRAFGWLALPGEIPFKPQFYRMLPGGKIA